MGEPPIDIIKVADCCGLVVEYVDRKAGFSGQLIRERRVIEVQVSDHRHRQRFTIAHEIGHYVLGHTPVYSEFNEDIATNPRRINDRQADAFASELLMPESQLKEYFLEFRRDYKAIARKFDVSDTAMFIRLEVAKLV
jgi:Zn-dependent peptidase ImmA (M78 family)